jgi:hypothetical protein
MTRPPIRLLAAAAAVTAASAFAAGCGGGTDPAADARAARAVAQRAVDGVFMQGDPVAACAALTPAAREETARTISDDVRRGQEPTCALGMAAMGRNWEGVTSGAARATAGSVVITDDHAVVTIEYAGAIRDRIGSATGSVRLARIDGRWLVADGSE